MPGPLTSTMRDGQRERPTLPDGQLEARVFRVDELLADVRAGRLRIPPFQRGFKWTRNDGLWLLDSIYRGYPVGTLLFREAEADSGETTFGPLTVHAGSRSDALWVVDGQQRLVSLMRILSAADQADDDFALHFDLDGKQFVVLPPAKPPDDPARWLPMTEVLDSTRLADWLSRHCVVGSDRHGRAIELGRRIRGYGMPAYVMHAGDERAAYEIFRRINLRGKALSEDEVFDAQNAVRPSSVPTTVPQLVDELRALGFGTIEARIVRRLMRVLQGADVARRAGVGPLRPEESDIEAAYRQTADVARNVVRFVRRDVGIAHYELLPYKQPLVTLGKFFQHHPKPHPRSRELLARWLWRGALNGSHRSGAVATRRALDLIKPDSEEDSVQGLLSIVGARPGRWPDAGDAFNFHHASSKLQALALMGLRPRDLETGSVLHLAPQEAPFQTIVSSVAGEAADELWRSAANRLAYPRCHGLRRLLTRVRDEAVLASHGIPLPAVAALRDGDAHAFLALRAEHLRRCFAAFFERHARWGESDRPSLASLVLTDEEG